MVYGDYKVEVVVLRETSRSGPKPNTESEA